MVDANGIPLGVLSAPANRHDSPLLSPTLEAFADLPEQASVHLDKAYDSKVTRRLLEERALVGVISEKGKNRAPLMVGLRWVVERTNSWHNAHKKLVWCTERKDRVIDFWIAFSNVIIIVRRLIRQAWSRYRWEDRPVRCP
jgi:IS5 family transposase